MCFIYNLPAFSTYTKSLTYNILDSLDNDILNFSDRAKLVILGVLNARTAEKVDYICNDQNDNILPLFENYIADNDIDNRFSMDFVVLSRGRALNDTCIQTGIRILNGRCTGDLVGNFTCHNQRGSSVGDYGFGI